ncbi:hypothetical protein H6P81_016754 [Aristolochia fimbriata]|uniref:RING-type domain-containing protein n=1 Tax=Aristolochia fimbriata TaxID=158543 RepID=A0AAV7E9L6_ARIFI|nr:hypothetical protein H6P81_016754 [Aristolochia fimbriata]
MSQDVKTRRKEDLLECPICWESFNLVENIPHVLWCGHTICKNCTTALRWASVKFQAYLIQLPFFISCPWCQMLSFRLVWKGNLSFPHKNYFLLWLVESVNRDQLRSYSSAFGGDQEISSLGNFQCPQSDVLSLSQHRRGHSSHQLINNQERWRIQVLVSKMTGIVVRLTAKFPVVLIFLFVVLYIIPASVAILAVYLLLTFLFAFPSFLVLYFSYPILDWLLREIAA